MVENRRPELSRGLSVGVDGPVRILVGVAFRTGAGTAAIEPASARAGLRGFRGGLKCSQHAGGGEEEYHGDDDASERKFGWGAGFSDEPPRIAIGEYHHKRSNADRNVHIGSGRGAGKAGSFIERRPVRRL